VDGGAADRDQLAPIPEGGRVFSEEIRVGPAEVTPGNRAKLDAIVGWLQDVAYHDVVEVGAEDAGFWIVRRTRVRVEGYPRFSEGLVMRTAATGASHALAERRTSIEGDAGAAIEAVSVWVNVDPETQMPARHSERFLEVYATAQGSKPRSKLRHPPPPGDAQSQVWTFRVGDLDVVGHVNNTRYWTIADELLVGADESVPLELEVEHRNAAQAGEAAVAVDGDMLWVSSPSGEVYASARRLG
jgi:acyl-ACP thioesterase